MSRTGMRRRRVVATVLVAAGVLAGTGAALGTTLASADTGIGSWRLAATAQGFQASAFGQFEGHGPQSEAAFETGPLGYALPAIRLAGPLGGNAGDLAVVLTD